jgi:hypothetical protein
MYVFVCASNIYSAQMAMGLLPVMSAVFVILRKRSLRNIGDVSVVLEVMREWYIWVRT